MQYPVSITCTKNFWVSFVIFLLLILLLKFIDQRILYKCYRQVEWYLQWKLLLATETCNISIHILFLEQKIENQSSERLFLKGYIYSKKRNATTVLFYFGKGENFTFLQKHQETNKSKNVDSLILNIMWLVSSRPIWQYFQ